MTFPARPRHGSPSSVPAAASHVHVRRWRAEDDDEPLFGPYVGGISDLSPETEPGDTGLVDVAGNPIPHPEPPRKPFGFQPPDCE